MPVDEKDLKLRIKAFEEYASDWHEEVIQDRRFYAGKQWDDNDLTKLRNEKRPALTFNRVKPIIDAISGTEIINRFEPKFFPRNATMDEPDTEGSEMLSTTYKYIRQQANAEHEESHMFLNAGNDGIGATETFHSTDKNPDGAINIDCINVMECGWDPSSKKRNLLDREWDFRGRWVSEDALFARWPKARKDVGLAKDTGGGTLFQRMTGANHDATIPWMKGNSSASPWFNAETRKILVVNHQWYEYEDWYRIYMPDGSALWVATADFEDFMGEQAAQAEQLAGSIAMYGTPEYDQALTELAPEAVKMPRRMYKSAFTSGPVVLEDGDAQVNGFSRQFVTAFADDSDQRLRYWFGVTRMMRDPQQYMNRAFSQLVHILGSNPKGAILYEPGLFQDESAAREQWNKAEGMIATTPGALADGQKKYEVLKGGGMPSGLEFLISFASEAVPLTAGVNESYFVGQAEDLRRTANASIQSVQKMSMTVLSGLFDSLRLYRKEHGRLCLQFIREFMPDGQVLRIVGEGKPIQYARDEAFAEYDVIVDETPVSVNEQMEVFDRVTQHGILNELMGAGMPLPENLFSFLPGNSDMKRDFGNIIKVWNYMSLARMFGPQLPPQVMQMFGLEGLAGMPVPPPEQGEEPTDGGQIE